MKKIMCLFIGIFCLSCLVSTTVFSAQTVPPEKRAEILKLIKLTNGPKLANEMKMRIIAALKESFPDAPADYWKKLEKRINTQNLLNMFVPIYAQNLSMEDLKQLIAFYKTPAGQHYLAAKDKMVSASAKKGKKWAMGWIVQVFKELKAKGYNPRSKSLPGKSGPRGKGGIDKSPNS